MHSPEFHGVVLLADDEDVVRLVARRLMERLGFTVDDVRNGAEAVTAVLENPTRYRLAIFDISMPVMNGLDASRVVRQSAPDLPILLMSGSTALDIRTTSDPAPVSGFLEKPFTLAELESTLRHVLGTIA